jgi:hypothetical protein
LKKSLEFFRHPNSLFFSIRKDFIHSFLTLSSARRAFYNRNKHFTCVLEHWEQALMHFQQEDNGGRQEEGCGQQI